ncbi:MAG: M16 family metallopeptidase, partial [Reyranella sp.]
MRHMLRAAVLAALLSPVMFAHAEAGAGIRLDAVIPKNPLVKFGTLPNGLTYYIQRNGKPEHRLELRLVIKAGSAQEDDDQQGLAHLLEHMAFEGSTHYKKHELVSYLQSIGMKFGPDLNAFTSMDETVYQLPVPTGRKEYVEQAFTVLEDWAHGMTLSDADIDAERPVVLEEARLQKGAGERIRKVLWPKLFNGSLYADRLPIGKEDIIRNARPETLRRFYRDWYRPDLMAVVVVGDVDPVEAERMIKAHFAGLSNPAHERPHRYPEIPPLAGTEAVVVTDKEVPTSAVELHYPIRFAPDAGTYGSYRDKLVEGLFGMMLNQRLAELSQQPAPPFMGAGAGITHMSPRYKGYMASASLGAGGSKPALTALLEEQQRLRQYGFTAQELERVRKATLHGYERLYNERDTTDSVALVDEYVRNFLANEEMPGIEAEYKLVQALLPGIGVEEINAFVRKTIPAGSGKLVTFVGPERKDSPAPSGAELLAQVSAAEHAHVAAREEKALASELMARPVKPGSIVGQTEDKRLGLTRLTLSNGVKVILKPTDFQKDQVLLSAMRYGGQSLFDEKDIPNARYASSVAGIMGLKDYAPMDLQKMLAGRSASVSMSLGELTDNIGASAGSSATDLETMFQFLWLRFDGARRDENLYKSYMGKQEEVLRNRLAMPEARFGDVLTDTMYGGHAYEPRATTLEDARKVSLDRSLEIYRQRFSSAKGLTFVMVGDFDIEKVKPLLTAYLGTLPTPDLPLAYRDVGLRQAKGVIRKEVLAGTEPKSTVSMNFTGPANWSPEEALRMGALLEIMNLRVNDVLREKLRLIYAGGVNGAVYRIPYQHYWVQAMLPTGPENVDKAIAAMLGEIDRLKTQGPDQAELDKFKQGWHVKHERVMRENGYWLSRLQSSLMDGTDPERMLNMGGEVDALTVADVQKTAQRYFDMQNYVQVVLKPEAQA